MQDVPGHRSSMAHRRPRRATRWIRWIFTLLGAGGLIAGAFLNWIRSLDALGIELNIRMLWQPDVEPKILTGGGLDSVGFVALVLGAIAILGLAPRTGWLTSLAGALGVAQATLFLVTANRAFGYWGPPRTMSVGDIQAGVWLLVAGGLVAFVAGFFGHRRRS
jgi:hypothetical protein